MPTEKPQSILNSPLAPANGGLKRFCTDFKRMQESIKPS